VYANQSGVRPWNGAMCNFTAGEAWQADDPFVAAHQDLFSTEPPKVRTTEPKPKPPVERATRRPGEKR